MSIRRSALFSFFPVLLALTWATSVTAIEPPSEEPSKARVFATDPLVMAEPSIETFEAGATKSMGLHKAQGFFAVYSDQWTVNWDMKSDRPELISGAGVPLFPNVKAKGGEAPSLGEAETLLRDFIAQQKNLLGVDNQNLILDPKRTVTMGKNHHFMSIELQQLHQGVPVEGARVFFRINHGRIVQFGALRVADVFADATPSLAAAEALELGLAASGMAPFVTEIHEQGHLTFIPMDIATTRRGVPYKAAPGFGYRHLLVWQYQMVLDDGHAYRLRVDAHSGELLEVTDLAQMAEVKGMVYPVTNNAATLTEVNLPFVSLTNGSSKVTDADGQYTYGGGTSTATLNGRYTRIVDNCGSISLSNSTNGDLDFGGAGGTDCTTPGVGGSGNTHSARTGFYHLTNINRKAAQFLPGNSWLDGTLRANMNINQNCNAFWNGGGANGTVNFYTSGGGCGNTGEIAAIFLHEWGHGLDQNAGGGSPENGTGEAVGDSFAAIELRDGCIGENFRTTACTGCRSSCTGVRDLVPFSLGGARTIATPANVTNNDSINCDRFKGLNGITCPYRRPDNGQLYRGVMGYEGNCESYIASTANWDLAQALVAEYGTEAGWAALEKIWYSSITPMGSAYRIASGGECNPNATINGCGADNWYTLYLAADDDDGNLSNGTPNGCRIWDAFNAHGIACGSRPACSTTCTPAPTADAGADVTICAGDSTTIGTAALAGHSYSWNPGGASTAQITVSPATTTTYNVTATTSCSSAQDAVVVTVDDGSGGGLSSNFDSGIGSWTTSGLWHRTTGSSCFSPSATSGSSAVYYGQDSGCNYNTGSTTTGDLTSPVISGLNSSSELSFQYFRQVESFTGGSYDKTEVAVKPTGSSTWTNIWTRDSANASENAWTASGAISLAAYDGQDIQIRFRFNSVDSQSNAFTGWAIDDVVVTATSNCGGTANTAPTVSISAPSGGTTVTEGNSVTFTGSASDSEDGNISANLSWSSSLDGNLGSGASISTSSLSVGSHTVTASVTDSGGLSDSATVAITVDQAGVVAQTATYDSALGAPKCGVVGLSCDSGASLILGRASKGPEPNQPNTLDSCSDGNSGDFHSDESNDRIKVSTTSGGALSVGATVTVEATVYAWSDGSNDNLDLYYAADANNPSWTLIQTLSPSAGGAQTLSATYTLPAGNLQAVRAAFRYQGSPGPCVSGNYNDRDDLVFAVSP